MALKLKSSSDKAFRFPYNEILYSQVLSTSTVLDMESSVMKKKKTYNVGVKSLMGDNLLLARDLCNPVFHLGTLRNYMGWICDTFEWRRQN